MAFDPSRAFTESSGKTAAILGIVALLAVLAAFALPLFGVQKKFPGPPLMGDRNGDEPAPSGDKDESA